MKKGNIISYVLYYVLGMILIFGFISLASYHTESLNILSTSKQVLESYKTQQRERKINNLEQTIKDLIINQSKIIETVKTNELLSEYRDSEQRIKLNKINEKPTYEYLRNITVYIHGEIPEKTQEDGTTRVKQGWVGTGSILKIENGDTYILTNNHVTGFKEPDYEEVILTVEENKNTYYAEVISNNPTYDVAIIKVRGIIEGKQAINGFAEKYEIQDKVYSVGNYLAIPYLYSEGTIAGYNKDNKENLLLVNLNVAGGCSGSAVVNSKGELVSVLFATYYVSMFSTDTARALTVPYLEIKDWLKENLK